MQETVQNGLKSHPPQETGWHEGLFTNSQPSTVGPAKFSDASNFYWMKTKDFLVLRSKIPQVEN